MRLDLPLYGCILFKNYIKPQQGETDDHAAAGCILFKNYIKPQPLYQRYSGQNGCILFKNYIKPQPHLTDAQTGEGCILFKNYIKPQRARAVLDELPGCILFKNYIKPQPRALTLLIFDCLQLFCQSKTMCCALRGSRFVRFFRSYRYKYIKKIPIVAAFRAVRARPDPRNSSCRRIACP